MKKITLFIVLSILIFCFIGQSAATHAFCLLFILRYRKAAASLRLLAHPVFDCLGNYMEPTLLPESSLGPSQIVLPASGSSL